LKQAVLVLAHGSRDTDARAEYRRLGQVLAARFGEVQVELSVLEFPGPDLPSIFEGLKRCADRGAQRVVALPFFLFAAGHVRDDLPVELEQAAAGLPGLKIAFQPPLGVDPLVLDVLESRAAEAAAASGDKQSGPTALLLVGAGTSDADANADLYRASRLLWERRHYEMVEVGFVSLTRPTVAEAVLRCRTLGAARVLLVPYFLNTGVLSRRIASTLEVCRECPDVRFGLSAEMGLHPILIDLLTERARRALRFTESNGLNLPPCARGQGAWACWLDG
jgi:sirohydrochlorin cobaltochelatase